MTGKVDIYRLWEYRFYTFHFHTHRSFPFKKSLASECCLCPIWIRNQFSISSTCPKDYKKNRTIFMETPITPHTKMKFRSILSKWIVIGRCILPPNTKSGCSTQQTITLFHDAPITAYASDTPLHRLGSTIYWGRQNVAKYYGESFRNFYLDCQTTIHTHWSHIKIFCWGGLQQEFFPTSNIRNSQINSDKNSQFQFIGIFLENLEIF